MIHRDIESLAEPMRKKISELIAACDQAGQSVFVFETLRDENVQAAYCAQGRESLERVNQLRGFAGLSSIGAVQNKQKITDDPPLGLATIYKGVGHGNGTAADIVPQKGNGALWWNAPYEVWEKIGKIGESLGLVWGGRWKSRDYPHFQMPRE
jgi:hypothetical protein